MRSVWSMVIVLALMISASPLPKAQGQTDARAIPTNIRIPQTSCDETTACCNPGYWIVSSRHCPQSGSQSWRCCRLAYLHVGPDGCSRQFDESAFHSAMTPGVPVCVVVHGSYTTWDALVSDARPMARWIRSAANGQPLNIVFFTWPSEPLVPLLPQIDITVLGRRGAYNGIYLTQIMSQIPTQCPVSLFGHSHGARTVVSSMHLQSGGEVQGIRLACSPTNRHRVRIILVAAAIDDHWLNPGERYGLALCQTESLLHLRNREDIVLRFYPLRRPFSGPALATTGFSRRTMCLMGPQAGKIAEMDVTRMIGTGHLWHNYYRHPELAGAIAPWLYFSDSPLAGRSQPIDRSVAQSGRARHAQPAGTVPIRDTYSNFKQTRPTSRR